MPPITSSSSGVASTLQVYVDDVRWTEAETLVDLEPTDRRYVTQADDDAKTTRYELRLPLNTLGIKPGAQFSFNVVVFDDDDGNGHRYWLELAPGLAGQIHDVTLYPRFRTANGLSDSSRPDNPPTWSRDRETT